MSDWVLRYEGFDRGQEGLREALCTLGNGYFATRGAAAEAVADDVHYPGTYAAGLYNRLRTEVAGRTVENEDLVNLPNWLTLAFRVEDEPWFDVRTVQLLEHVQELDLLRGLLTRTIRWRDASGRTTRMCQRRVVHMGNRHLAALDTEFVAEDWSGALTVRSGLDGRVVNAGVARYRELRGDHLVPLHAGAVDSSTIVLVVETATSHQRIGEAARTRVLRAGTEVDADRRLVEEPGFVAHDLAVELATGEPVSVEKVVALHTSRDRPGYEPAVDACTTVERADGFEALLDRHALEWENLWRRFDLRLDGSERAQLVLRVHLFHLLQTVSEHTADLDVGVPARGLHGEAYRGHVFWDELFVFPLLSFRLSALTRALLLYRHRRLPEARWAARRNGLAGATFPWQSGSTGREETQELHLNPKSGRWLPDNSRLQRHINLAVAYNVWEYWEVTGDVAFLRFQGAEMLIEIARFFADLATYDPERDRYEIRRVMGPDEYHDGYPGADEPGIHNNAYTNVMVAWLLCRVLELFDVLPGYHGEELRAELGLAPGELERWETLSRRLVVPFHDGVISQFEGYGELEEFDWEGYRAAYGDIHRLDRILEAEGDTANRYKVSKQADVLMLFYLFSADELQALFDRLGYPFDGSADIARNVDYYLERTSHGSTLSRVVHAWLLAHVDRGRSWAMFLEALESDVADIQGGTTQEGIHLGAMAGTVDLVQRCYGGLDAHGGVLWFDPVLPPELPHLEFGVHYRGQRLRVTVTHDRLRVSSAPGIAAPVRVGLRGEVHELAAGRSVEAALA